METFQSIQNLWELSRENENISGSRHFSESSESFYSIRKLSRRSKDFPEHPKKFPGYQKDSQSVQKCFRMSENFLENSESCYIAQKPEYLETFQSVKKCLNSLESFQSVWMLYSLQNIPEHPKTFPICWKLSIVSRKFPKQLETFQSIWKLSKMFLIFQLSRKFSILSKKLQSFLLN